MTTDLLELSASILDGSATIDSHHPLRMSRQSTLQEVADRVAFVEAFANVVAIDTDDGLVLVDAAGPLHAAQVHEAIRGWSDRFRRYEMTNGYNARINQRQFQLGSPIFPGGYRYPDET